jgi:hypothetical protein
MAIKKSLGIGLVIGLLAMAFAALPAMASAAPTIKSGGSTLKVGTAIKATSSNSETVTVAGTLKCTSVSLEGKITENPGAKIGSGSGSTSGCTAGGSPITVSPVTVTSITFNTGGTGTAAFSFGYNIGVSCTLSATAAPFTYSGGTVQFSSAALVGSGTGCPTSGSFSGKFTLTTAAGAAVEVV